MYCSLLCRQVCFKDLWYLETERPSVPGRILLVRASTNSLEISWSPVPSAEAYVVQVQRFEPSAAVAPSTSAPSASTVPAPLSPGKIGAGGTYCTFLTC